MPLMRPGWRALSLLLATSGVAHLVRPRPFAGIVPRVLGAPGPWVLASGVAELTCAAGLAAPRTRSRAAVATAALFVGVYPANVQMAVDALRGPSRARQVVALVRLPLQVPLILASLSLAHEDGHTGRTA